MSGLLSLLATAGPAEPPIPALRTVVTTPTPDGTGHGTHPSVLDMRVEHGGPWNGYRWWMAFTPYHGSNVTKENPAILASNDRANWVVPAGLTNPIDPWPGPTTDQYNSDTELVFDADTDTMYCYWRDYKGGTGVPGNLVLCYSTSTDGVTWTAQQDALTMTYPDTGGIFSPAIVKVGSTWRLWMANNSGACHVRTAPSPAGPWSAPTDLTFNGSFRPGGLYFWHWGMRERDGIIYALASDTSYGQFYALTSTNGVAWSFDSNPILPGRSGEWDRSPYRPTLTFAPGADHADVWYGAIGANTNWRIGYTSIPLSAWPNPPA